LRRLRTSQGLLHPRKEFKKKPIEPKHVVDAKYAAECGLGVRFSLSPFGRDDRVLSIPLMTAERAWAYAMQLKAQAAEEKDNTRLKFHVMRRLQRAAACAAQLEALCATCATPRTQLEAEAYGTWMRATLCFERNAFPEALQQFLRAKYVQAL
jgi:hypothetical protein